jgi:hypothetical protein
MVGYEFLSPALVNIMNQAVAGENGNMIKYLIYEDDSPLSNADVVDPQTLLNRNIFPTPFDDQITSQANVQLRVFYLNGLLQDNQVVDGVKVIFDLVCAKRLWLIHDINENPQVRPYEMLAELEKQFRKVSVPQAGRLHFTGFHHVAINAEFDAVRVTATMKTFSDGK